MGRMVDSLAACHVTPSQKRQGLAASCLHSKSCSTAFPLTDLPYSASRSRLPGQLFRQLPTSFSDGTNASPRERRDRVDAAIDQACEEFVSPIISIARQQDRVLEQRPHRSQRKWICIKSLGILSSANLSHEEAFPRHRHFCSRQEV